MSKTAWTPGPWEVCNSVDIYPVGDFDARYFIADCDPENAPIETLNSGENPDTDMTYQQVKANARLIAAAPELYEALEALSTFSGSFADPDDRERLNDMMAAGRAALAKARGE